MYIGGSKFTNDPEKIKEHEELLAAISKWIECRSNRRPEAGEYDPFRPEKHQPTVDFDKMQARADYFEDSDGEPGEGDVLILDPQLPEDHKPAVDFGKMVGRGDDF